MSNLKFKLATIFCVIWPIGYFPFASGTLASLFAASLGYFINLFLGGWFTIMLAVFSGIIGWWSTRIYLEKNNSKDPSEIVVDEFSGQLIATSAAGVSPVLNILAFFLFRFFDIFKPGIIGKSETFKGATGVMMDDWLSGLFSAAIIFVLYIFGF